MIHSRERRIWYICLLALLACMIYVLHADHFVRSGALETDNEQRINQLVKEITEGKAQVINLKRNVARLQEQKKELSLLHIINNTVYETTIDSINHLPANAQVRLFSINTNCPSR